MQGVVIVLYGRLMYDPLDPPSVTAVRQQGAALIAQWVREHNTMKTQTPMSNAANVFDLSYLLGGYTNPLESINDTLPGSDNVRNQLQWYDSMNSSASNSNPTVSLLALSDLVTCLTDYYNPLEGKTSFSSRV